LFIIKLKFRPDFINSNTINKLYEVINKVINEVINEMINEVII